MATTAPGYNGTAADGRRQEIVSRAAELFDELGYHQTSMVDIANAVGLGKPTLYHYFSGKDEILFWIHDEFIELVYKKHLARARKGAGSREQLAGVIADSLELMETHRGHVRAFFENQRELSPEHSDIIRAKRQRYTDLVEDIVRRANEAGEFATDSPRLASLAIFGMCNWAYQWYRPQGSMSAAEIADFFWRLVADGLLADNYRPVQADTV